MTVMQLIEVLARVAHERGNIPVVLGGRDCPLVEAQVVEFVEVGSGLVVVRTTEQAG